MGARHPSLSKASFSFVSSKGGLVAMLLWPLESPHFTKNGVDGSIGLANVSSLHLLLTALFPVYYLHIKT